MKLKRNSIIYNSKKVNLAEDSNPMILNIAEKAQFAYNDGDQKAKSRVKNLEKFLEKQQH